MQALKGRHIMSHALVKNHIHLVFGVKDRRIKVVYEILPDGYAAPLKRGLN